MSTRPPQGPGEALSFLLDVAEAEGGLCDRGPDTSLMVLPRPLRERFDLDEEVAATSDPETAREDGALLVVHGHPVIDRAASLVLDRGDVGLAHLPWPGSAPPGASDIVLRAREAIQVDHGRIDPAGTPPVEVYVPVLRVGVLVSYATSLEDRFQECEEVWVDAADGRPLSPALRAWLQARTPDPGAGRRPQLPADVPRAIGAAHAQIEARATTRQAELARQTRSVGEDEAARARAYYRGILESLERRRAGATAEQAAVLDAQAEVTLAERDRRLAEIAERNEARHELRPFRLHLIGLPALTVLATVRRGERSYPLALTWLLGGPGLRAPACPQCGALAPLVAGRERLGCSACQPRKAVTVGEPPEQAPKPPAIRQPADGAAGAGTRAPDHSAPGKPAALARPHPGQPARGAPPAPPAAGRASPARPPVPARASPGRRMPRSQPVSTAPPDSDDSVERVVAQIGNALAIDLFEAAVTGKECSTRRVRKNSPMAALLRLYGSPGPLRAIGVAPDAFAIDMEVLGTWLRGDSAATSGAIETTQGRRPFSLTWRLGRQPGMIGEVLPYESPLGHLREPGQLRPGVASVVTQPPAPSVVLDPVAAQVWRLAVPSTGLHLAVRALALWWQVRPSLRRASVGEGAVAQAVVNVTREASGLAVKQVRHSALAGSDAAEVSEMVSAIRRLLTKEPGAGAR